MNIRVWRWLSVLSGLALGGVLLAGIVMWQTQSRPVASTPLAALAPARQAAGDGAPAQDAATPSPAAADFMSPLPMPSPVSARPPDAPPFCTFGGEAPAETAPAPSILDKFVFSEPTVVLTDEVGSDILGWLPGSNQLFIVRYHPDRPLRVIETWDAVTSKIRRLATQTFLGGRPFWVDAAGVVAYRETEILDKQSGQYRANLWVSTPESDEVTQVVQDLRQWNVSIGEGGDIVRFSPTPDALAPLPEAIQRAFIETVIPADLSTLLYSKYAWEVPEGHRPKEFSVVRSPNGRLFALYANPYLYLYDTSLQSICEVTLGESPLRFPLMVQWSPDGQILAMITANTPPGALVRSPQIILLNVITGEQKQPRVEGDPVGISWGPDSRHLLIMSRLDKEQWRPIDKLFLMDAWLDKTRLLFPDQIWGGGSRFEVSDVAWSPNGQEVAIKCPRLDEKEGIMIEDRICLSSVKTDR